MTIPSRVALELGSGDADFGFHDVLDAEGQIGHSDFVLNAVVEAVSGLKVEAGNVHERLCAWSARGLQEPGHAEKAPENEGGTVRRGLVRHDNAAAGALEAGGRAVRL